MNNKALLNLTYLNNNNQVFYYDKLVIDHKEYKINDEKSITIKFNDFEKIGSKVFTVEYFKSKYNQVNKSYLQVIHVDNCGIILPKRGFTRDILFPDYLTHIFKFMMETKHIKKNLKEELY